MTDAEKIEALKALYNKKHSELVECRDEEARIQSLIDEQRHPESDLYTLQDVNIGRHNCLFEVVQEMYKILNPRNETA